MELNFTDQELAALKKEYASNATDEQFQLWLAECRNRGLVPVRDVVLQIRGVKEWDADAKAKIFKQKAIYITTIGALRKIAERTGQYAGQKPSQWVYLDASGNPTIVSDVPLPQAGSEHLPRQPWAAKAFIMRHGWAEPITVPARWGAYAQTYTSNNETFFNQTWSNRGPEQLEKCAEALALRKAFPEELGGLFIAEELKDEDPDPRERRDSTPVDKVIPEATSKPEVNHTPAEGKVEPRPGEKEKEKKTRKQKSQDPPPQPKEESSASALPQSNAATPPPPTENLHGVKITDDDLPENLQPAKEAAPEKKDDKPTADDKKAYSEKCRAYAKAVGSEALRKFIVRTTGVTDTRDLTKNQWEGVLNLLAKAAQAGDQALKDAVAEPQA